VPLIFLGEQLIHLLDGPRVVLLVSDDANALQDRDAPRVVLELSSPTFLSQQVAPATLEPRDGFFPAITAIFAQGVDVSAG
jgi:hypothetical protein